MVQGKGLELGEPIIKEDKVYLPFYYKVPLRSPLDFLAIDSNLFSLDSYDGEKFITFSLKELYSLKYGMVKKRGKVHSFASKHKKKGKELLRKYSHRERNKVIDYVHKFVNSLLELYPLTTFVVEKLNKQEMFNDADNSLSRKISRTVWRTIHKVLKYKALLYGSRVVEVNPHLTSRSCPRCGFVSRKVGKTFICERCGFKLDRQLNASLKIFLKMCGFPHLVYIPSRWVGVIPLMGRRRVKVGKPLDSREAQGLILSYMKSDETQTPLYSTKVYYQLYISILYISLVFKIMRKIMNELRYEIKVSGICCGYCVANVKDIIKRESKNSVDEIEVKITDGTIRMIASKDLDVARIIESLNRAGYYVIDLKREK